jgi:hypothetical protein
MTNSDISRRRFLAHAGALGLASIGVSGIVRPHGPKARASP